MIISKEKQRARYENIMKLCRKEADIGTLLASIDMTPHTINYDLRCLVANNVLKVDKRHAGKYNALRNHYTTIIPVLTDKKLDEIMAMKSSLSDEKIRKLKSLPKDESDTSVTVYGLDNKSLEEKYRMQSQQMRRERRSVRVYVSGSSLSAYV